MFAVFLNDQSGAVTVDFVVMTAAIVGLGVAVTQTVSTGTCTLAHGIDQSLTQASVVDLGRLGDNSPHYAYGGPCGGTPEHPVMDCGVVWTFGIVGQITGSDGNLYNINASNVVVDQWGQPAPLMISGMIDGDGEFVTSGPFDLAGRLVDNNGVPLPPAADC